MNVRGISSASGFRTFWGAEEAMTLMEYLPPGGTSRLATKDDLQALEGRLLAEIHRSARNFTLSLTTIMTVLIGIAFAALKLS
jgi:hypothetical protein